MFDFTKEVVLNALTGIEVLAPADDPFVPTGDLALFVPRANKYLASGVPAGVFKSPGYAPVKEVGTITLPASQTAGTYRFEIDITTSGSYPIEYDRWAVDKGKPLYIEFNVPTTQATADNFATVALAAINKGLKKMNGSVITDIVLTKGTGTLIITAKNEYLRFKNATVTKLDLTTQEFGPIGATYARTTAGKEGFGTAWYLTANVRIPTQEATRFMGENQDETPVVGTIYNQYSFQYEQARNFTGQAAVGQKIESKTTHVYWVPQTLSADFEALIITDWGVDLTDAITKTPITI